MIDSNARYVVMDGVITEVGDGDTINFVPNDLTRFELLPADSKKPVLRIGAYPIRFQGIDTPELHIGVDRDPELKKRLPHATGADLPTLPGPVHAQPMGDVAGRRLKELAGFHEEGMQQAGVVLVSTTDVYGRLIAYAFVAEDAEDLLGTMSSTIDEGDLDDALLTRSLNFQMLQANMAYYTGYSGMPERHRELFAAEAAAARERKAGIWQIDPGWDQPVTLHDESAIGPHSNRLILPKLYRRCISYLFSVNADDFTGDLREWTEATTAPGTDPNTVDVVEIRGERKPFMDLIQLGGRNNREVSLTADPLEMVFIENHSDEHLSRTPVLTKSE